MTNPSITTPRSWLGFELNILRRLDFRSVALPFAGDPTLGLYLKKNGARVLANDSLQSAWTRALAVIQNNGEQLSDQDVEVMLEDVYVPGHKLKNSALLSWFSEIDAWWFDNIRQNLDKVESPFAFALGASLVMSVGDYALSFKEDTLEYRKPLSKAFAQLRAEMPNIINNNRNNTCLNKPVDAFLAEVTADLLFLKLPAAGARELSRSAGLAQWKEEWLRGGNDFWPEFESAGNGRLGGHVETKSQYLMALESSLRTASHIPNWAISHIDGGLISTSDIVGIISDIRRIDKIYTKDFSELLGMKAVIITA